MKVVFNDFDYQKGVYVERAGLIVHWTAQGRAIVVDEQGRFLNKDTTDMRAVESAPTPPPITLPDAHPVTNPNPYSQRPCPICDGAGRLRHMGGTCPACSGRGWGYV